MRKHRGFTLIELLVVVSILGLLMAILIPSLQGARRAGKRTACAATLRQVGVALFAYMEENNHRLPHASATPSITPVPLDVDEDAIRIADLLRPFAGNESKAFQCPADTPGRFDRVPPNTGKSWFQSEGSSYQYRTRGSDMGLTIMELVEKYKRRSGDAVPENTIWLMRDYNNFHGEGGKPGARRYLYIDGHVGDYENF